MLEENPQVVGVVWSEYEGRADWPLETTATAVAAMGAALAQWTL